jgi:hypothetical protein
MGAVATDPHGRWTVSGKRESRTDQIDAATGHGAAWDG